MVKDYHTTMSHEVSRRELLKAAAGAVVLASTHGVEGAQPDVFTELPLTKFVIGKNTTSLDSHVPAEIRSITDEASLPVATTTMDVLTIRQTTRPFDPPEKVGKGITELRFTPDPESPQEPITVFLPKDAKSVAIAARGDSGTASNMISGVSGRGEGNRYLVFTPAGNKPGPNRLLLRVR